MKKELNRKQRRAMERFDIPMTEIDWRNIESAMPKYNDIPEEFKNWNNKNKWSQFFSDLFFSGVVIEKLTAKKGIDAEIAFNHIQVIARSWDCKHEHKEAACAYLLSKWFDDVKYTIKPKRSE